MTEGTQLLAGMASHRGMTPHPLCNTACTTVTVPSLCSIRLEVQHFVAVKHVGGLPAASVAAAAYVHHNKLQLPAMVCGCPVCTRVLHVPGMSHARYHTSQSYHPAPVAAQHSGCCVKQCTPPIMDPRYDREKSWPLCARHRHKKHKNLTLQLQGSWCPLMPPPSPSHTHTHRRFLLG